MFVLSEIARKRYGQFQLNFDTPVTRSEIQLAVMSQVSEPAARQAWITLSFAVRGIADPFIQASYQIYGVHPDKVWPNAVADRKARLGAEYHDWYNSADLLRQDVPKIPPTNVDSSHLLADSTTGAGVTGIAGPVLIPEKENLA